MANDFNIIIVDSETFIGYKKDLMNYMKDVLNDFIKTDINNENGINNILGTLRYLNDYEEDELLKISECPMDEYGVKIEVLD